MLIDHEDKQLYLISYLMERNPEFFGNSVQRAAALRKAKVPIPNDVVYWGIKTTRGLRINNTKTSNDSVALILKEWVDANVPGFPETNDTEPVVKIIKRKPVVKPTTTVVKPKSGAKSEVTPKYEPAPPILKVDDAEKFVDSDGNLIDIEIRGERTPRGCYFRAAHVGAMLNIVDIKDTITKSTSTFEHITDYVVFMASSGGTLSTPGQKRATLFLTYLGLLRLLFVRRHPIARQFQEWAIDILFTVKHGTPEAKRKLTEKIMADVATVRAVLKKGTTPLSAIYLFKLGFVKDLRTKLGIDVRRKLPDNHIVCKYGFTSDLERRTGEHGTTYGKSIELMVHAAVERKFLSECETSIREFFEESEWTVEHATDKELVAIDPCCFGDVFRAYTNAVSKYEGTIGHLRCEIDSLNDKLTTISEKADLLCERAEHFQAENNELRGLLSGFLKRGGK